jgi:hypothetical protein
LDLGAGEVLLFVVVLLVVDVGILVVDVVLEDFVAVVVVIFVFDVVVVVLDRVNFMNQPGP